MYNKAKSFYHKLEEEPDFKKKYGKVDFEDLMKDCVDKTKVDKLFELIEKDAFRVINEEFKD